ncbi:MAG: PH domain-containing protein [Lachnospiraceae bacterium]|nr:PH domain-containing protein [Lachnospiraceae bacterium]
MDDFLEKHQGVVNAAKGFLVIVVIVVVLYTLGIFKSAAVKIEIEDEVFSVYYEDEIVIQFSKDEIQSAKVVQTFTEGNAVNVVSEEKYTVGTWENEEWGEYTVCVKQSVKSYLVVTTDEETFVFNYESADSTEAMCDALIAW